MEPGFVATTETKTAPELADQKLASLAQKADIVKASRIELDQWVRTDLVWEPSIVLTDEGLSYAPMLPDEEEFSDSDEIYDSPQMEENIEVGEGGASPQPLEDEPSDSFFWFVCERMEIDFGDSHREPLTGILDRLDSGEIAISEVPESYRDWLQKRIEEMGEESAEADEPSLKQPDIVFFVREGELAYEIDMGLLEGIRLNRNIGISGQSRISFKGREVPVSVIPKLIQWRRISLGILADYLIEKQRRFLLSPDLRIGLRVLCSHEQKDLAKYYVDVLDLNKKEGKPKKGEDWASRLLKGKYIKVPFQEEPLSGKFFFDAKIEVLTILERAMAHHKSRTGKKLSFNAVAVVLKALGVIDSKASNIGKTYGKFMPSMVPGYELLGDSRIKIPDLTVLINAIGKDLGLLDSDLEKDAIAAIWMEKK